MWHDRFTKVFLNLCLIKDDGYILIFQKPNDEFHSVNCALEFHGTRFLDQKIRTSPSSMIIQKLEICYCEYVFESKMLLFFKHWSCIIKIPKTFFLFCSCKNISFKTTVKICLKYP